VREGVGVRPLVSVITPTIPERHALLFETLDNVRRQTYPNIEHIVVSDGPDDVLARNFAETIDEGYVEHPGFAYRIRRSLRFAECGRHWTGLLSDSYAAAPFIVGQFLARGEYAMPWADDERALDPDHIAKLVDLLESSGADFTYSITELWWKDEPERRKLIWADPPAHGSITHWMYTSTFLEKAKGPYRTHVGRANDWDQISRAMAGGATWAFLPEITFQHRVDVDGD
jgi:glycosyltransferase involved in cell wall biosynthesis